MSAAQVIYNAIRMNMKKMGHMKMIAYVHRDRPLGILMSQKKDELRTQQNFTSLLCPHFFLRQFSALMELRA
jgi:hypothetical protein